jgi:hypothetical protein
VKLKGVFSGAIAIACGLLVLAGYFFPKKANGQLTLMSDIRLTLLNWAVILAAFAVLVGIINLLLVHSNKIRTKQKGVAYSAILIIAMLVTFFIGLAAHFIPSAATLFNDIFRSVQLPVEASLMAVLAVTLTYAGIRLLRRRRNVLSIIFLVTALLVLFCTAPLPFLGYVPVLSDVIRPFITQVLAAGGARGILLGVALGTLTTGLRIILGADRPYGGK